jgi:O-antigen/teichoic acid export membrane protein
MSRLKKFTRSLISGYILLAANIIYTLVSVPLALHYLGKVQFGLWAVITQLGGYIALIDLGMNSSIARILIDHKDDRANGFYGSVIKTGALVGVVQGALILLAGISLSTPSALLLKVPAELRHDFVWIMIGQSVLIAISFAARIFNQLLFAHQRLDIGNYGSTISTILCLALIWLGFVRGYGIYSFLLGQTVLILAALAVNLAGCLRLRLLPASGEWGTLSFSQFRELFAYGQGVFLISVGSQFINTSQTILIARLLGLEAAATWTICTRASTIITLVVWRIMDYSSPALSEMFVRKERGKLLERIRDLAVLMAGLSVVCGTLFATGNSSFVKVWTSAAAGWPEINNILLALWFLACSIMRVHTGLVGISKELHFLRFIYLIEGSVFIVLNLLAYRIENMTLMLAVSLGSTLCFTLPYGLMRTRKYFELTWAELLGWLRPTGRLAWRLLTVALITWWLAQPLPSRWQLVLDLVVPGIAGTLFFLRYGLESRLRLEISEKLPPLAQMAIKRLVCP